MASFNYIGRNNSGNQVKGTIEANNTSAVAEQLIRKNITPISIVGASKNSSNNLASKNVSEIFGFDKVSLDELIIFSRQMYALMRSGVPILRAIHGMADASTSNTLKKSLN